LVLSVSRAIEAGNALAGFYSPSSGTIYPTLQLLVDMGHVNAVKQDSKKIYNITEEGKKFLKERKDLADGIKKQMKHFWESDNREDIAEMMEAFQDLKHLLGQQSTLSSKRED